jgi:hypothetical protein
LKLLNMRAKIFTQKNEAEKHIYNLHLWAQGGYQVNADEVQRLKFRNGALRGLVGDLKKLADEIDPPGPAVECPKLLAEYDALVLRLAKTPIGRLLATTKPKEWRVGTDLPPADQATAVKLLNLRDQVVAQKEAFEGHTRGLKDSTGWKARLEASKGDPEALATHANYIKTHEAGLKLATETLRGLVRDFRKLADEIDPPKGK